MHIWYNLAENNVTEKIEKYVKLLIAVYLELKFDPPTKMAGITISRNFIKWQ
jgi:hypothetical protein